MTFPIHQVVFFIFSAVVIAAALMVITSRNPVRAVLFLVLAFFASSVLWMLLQAEFIALLLIFVYVGAVMTLFLFVVMMLNIDLSAMREKFVRFLPLSVMVMLSVVALLFLVLGPHHLNVASVLPQSYGPHYNNVQVLGTLLYTDYILPFEIASAILLVSIISAIALAFHGRKANTKTQNIDAQHAVRKADRLRIINMKSEKS